MTAQPIPQQILSPQDLADRHQVGIRTVYQWNHKGTGPKRIRVGKHVRYRLEDVLAWEESRVE